MCYIRYIDTCFFSLYLAFVSLPLLKRRWLFNTAGSLPRFDAMWQKVANRLTFSSKRISQRYRGKFTQPGSQPHISYRKFTVCRTDLQNTNYMFIIPILFVKIIISEYAAAAASEPQRRNIKNIYAAFVIVFFSCLYFSMFCVCVCSKNINEAA